VEIKPTNPFSFDNGFTPLMRFPRTSKRALAAPDPNTWNVLVVILAFI
jgi:hypothetical protein